jgi:DNA-binding FadR family transcriptional regulator
MATPSLLPVAPRTSLVESVLTVMRVQIETGAWKVSERIPKEAELAERLNVGRNTVREAVRVLSHAGVLEVRQGDGTYLRSSVDPIEIMRRVSRTRLRDHFELRLILEVEAARLAAVRRTDEDVERLTQLLRQRGEVPSREKLEEFVDRDVAFHAGIVEAAHNTALEELYRYFSAAVKSGTLALMAEKDLPEARLAAHAKIIEAIKRQNPDEAAHAVRAVVAPLISKVTQNSRE